MRAEVHKVRKPVLIGWSPQALALAPITHGDKSIMPYRERLSPWVLVRLLPNMQQVTVAQHRSRSDADGHLEIIRRLMPNDKFVVMFNLDVVQPQQADTCPRTRTSGR